MPSKHSRRDVLAKGAMAGAMLAVPVLAKPQTPASSSEMKPDLAKPLSDEARKLAAEQLKAMQDRHRERLKVELPENSEPCFTFVPTPKGTAR